MSEASSDPLQRYYYDSEEEEFIEFTVDQNGNVIDNSATEMLPEDALRTAAVEYFLGSPQYPVVEEAGEVAKVDFDNPSAHSKESFINERLIPAIRKITKSSETEEKKIARLSAAVTDWRVIDIIVEEGLLDDETIRAAWPSYEYINTSSENPYRTVVIQKRKRIPGTEAQGLGPLPPRPLTQDSAENAPHDSRDKGTASSPLSDSKTGGDPIVLFSGQFYYQVTDLEVKGRGLHFAFIRTYLHQALYDGSMGHNWDHIYNLWLREEQERLPDGTIQNVVYRSNGQLREDRYVQKVGTPLGDLAPLAETADAVFQAPPGFFDRLEKSGARYTLQTVAGIRFEYNDDLFIERILDNNGNEMTFEYTENLLTKIRDPVGKEYILNYDETNRMSSLHDPTGERNVEYSYGFNGDLEEVHLHLEPDFILETDYRYSGGDVPFEMQHNLIEIINPMGHSVLQNEYGFSPGTWEFNRVTHQRSADGEYHYEYGPISLPESSVDPATDPVNVPTRFTRVLYPNCHSVEHWFNEQGNVVQRSEVIVSDVTGNLENLVAQYRYNEDGLLIEEKRPGGEVIEYRYQREAYEELHGGDSSGATPSEWLEFGNLLRNVERPRPGLGEERSIVTEYRYLPQVNRMRRQRGPYYADAFLNPLSGQEIADIHYDYDSRGNLTHILLPELRLPDGTVQVPDTPTFEYNEHGLITDIRVGSTHTQYTYFDDLIRSGFVRGEIADADGQQITTRYDVDELGRATRITNHHGSFLDIEWTKFDVPRQVRNPSIIPDVPGPLTTYKYDHNRQAIRIEEEIMQVDGADHLPSSAPPETPLIQTFSYDPFGRVVEHSMGSATNASFRTRKMTYTSFGSLEREVDFRGSSTFLKYDERMNLSEITNALGTSDQRTRKVAYNNSGEIVKELDARNSATIITRDAFGRQKIIEDPEGNTYEREYDAAGRVTLEQIHGLHPEEENGTKVRWAQTDIHYDAIGRLIERVDHLFIPGSIGPDELLRTQYFYDTLNRLHFVRNPEGGELSYEYDNLGRITSARDEEGNEVRRIYDEVGRKITEISRDIGTDENSNEIEQFFTQTVSFDTRKLPVRQTDGLGNIKQLSYDSRALLTRFVNAKGQAYLTDYDIFGQPIVHYTNIGQQHEIRVEARYDKNGNILEITSPIGGKVGFEYDWLNRPVSMRRNGSIISTNSYDKEDNLVRAQNENQFVTNRTFSDAGLLLAEEYDVQEFSPPPEIPSYSPAPITKCDYRYTPLRTIKVARNGISESIMRYDSLGRILGETSNELSVLFRYSPIGLRIGITFPDGRDISYGYARNGLLISIQQNAIGNGYPGNLSLPPVQTLASIHRIGRRPLSIRFADNHIARFSYDGNKHVVGIDWSSAFDETSTLLLERNLYGSSGERKIQQLDGNCRIFGYDELNRLINVEDYSHIAQINLEEIAPADSEEGILNSTNQTVIDSLIESIQANVQGGLTPVRRFSYRLDDNTNRIQTEEQTSPDGGATITQYVADSHDVYQSVGGNSVIHDRAGNMLDDGVNSYRYDAINRLAEIVTPEGSIQLSRDALGRMVRHASPSVVYELVHAGSRIIELRTSDHINSQIVPLDILNQYAHLSSEGESYAPLFDVSNSIVSWTASTNSQIIGSTRYDPFGQILERGPVWPSPFGFAGYWFDEIAQIYQLAGRSYHPSLGRFLQRDPMSYVDGMNLYAYVHHSPGNLIDYFGFMSKDADWNSPRKDNASVFGERMPEPESSGSSDDAPETGTVGTAGAAASQTAPAAERFIWNHPFSGEGIRGSQRGFIIQNMYTNNPRFWQRDNVPNFDYEPQGQNKVQQIKSTASTQGKYLRRLTTGATGAASRAITANPTGTMAGKNPQAVIITPTDAPTSVGNHINNALGNARRAIPNSPLPPEHVRGLPGIAGAVGKMMTGFGFALSGFALGADIARGDVPMGVGNALGTVGGGLELYAIGAAAAGIKTTVAGVSAMTAGLAIGGLGIAVTSGVSGVRAFQAGDTAGAVAGAIGTGAGLAIGTGALGIVAGVAGAPLLLAGGIVASIGVGVFHAGRYYDWW